MSDFMVTSFQSDTAYSYWSVFIRNLEQTNCFPQKYECSIIFLLNPYSLGTIHLRRRQIFTIFDPYPPTIGIPAKCL